MPIADRVTDTTEHLVESLLRQHPLHARPLQHTVEVLAEVRRIPCRRLLKTPPPCEKEEEHAPPAQRPAPEPWAFGELAVDPVDVPAQRGSRSVPNRRG